MKPASPARILREKNLEIRRVLLERLGYEDFLRRMKARPVRHDDFGKLYRIRTGFREPLAFVEVLNSTPEPDGSRKAYFLRVPPAVRTAREGVAWTFGLAEQEYLPATET